MLDAPPAVTIELSDKAPEEVAPHLPMETAADVTLVIDLTPLAPRACASKMYREGSQPA